MMLLARPLFAQRTKQVKAVQVNAALTRPEALRVESG
jgi:hypothetical protein